MAGPPQQTAAEEQALIDGFFSGAGMAELRLLEVLRPKVRKLVSKRWPPLWPQVDDLMQSVYVQLFAMRDGKKERIHPPLIEAMSQLLNREVKELLRDRRRSAELPEDQPGAFVSPDAGIDGRRLLGLLSQLPDEQASVLLLQAAEAHGEGPALHEALGVTPELARKRLAYARKLLFQLADPQEAADA